VDRFSSRVARDVDRYLSGRREIVGHTVLPIVSGPSSKSLRRVDDVVRILDASGLGAGDRIVAVGGGTLLDLVGTAALVYRGRTPYLRVPTTLVGMIDAGIGLKVGVDVSQRKNLLGGYHPPLACLCDPAFLSTLPDRELRCGLAEATKIAMVVDRDLFELIERFHDHVLDRRDTTPVRQIIDGAIAAMLGELETNPYERDLRRRADFGHEFGHLLESASRFQLRHGEAVAIGMALSSQLGVLVGRQRAADHRRFVRLLTRIGLPTFHPLCEPARLWRWLREDVCAAKGGAPHLVVPTGIGSAGFVDSMDDLTPETVRLACSLLAGAGP
jgi:3-dehydroquinate synthetase